MGGLRWLSTHNKKGSDHCIRSWFEAYKIESDAHVIVNMLNKRVDHLGDIGVVLNDILALMSDVPNASFSYVPRVCNMVAHSAARWSLVNDGDFVWLEKAPLLLASVMADSVSSCSDE